MRRLIVLMLLVFAASARLPAAEIQPVPVDAPQWYARHQSFLQLAQSQPFRVLFLGDSITDYWRNDGQQVWNERIAPLQAANFGIGGDKIDNVLWRVQNGELSGISPQVVVLLIGTNNLPVNTIEEIEAGHARLVAEIRSRLPASKLLLLAIFPRVDDWSVPFRDKIPPVNRALGALADGTAIGFLDIGANFLSPDGGISRDVMYDGLHPTAQGYRIWADGMLPALERLLVTPF